MNNTINIPDWVARNTELNWNEKALYAVYHYFTFFGEYKCCKLTVAELCNRLGLEERTLQRCKKHLKELGYISTDGGITTTALNRGDKNDTLGVTKMVVGGDKNDTHNREENKEIIENNTYNISYLYRTPKNLNQFWSDWDYVKSVWSSVELAELIGLYNHYDNQLKVLLPTDQYEDQKDWLWSDLNKEYDNRPKHTNG